MYLDTTEPSLSLWPQHWRILHNMEKAGTCTQRKSTSVFCRYWNANWKYKRTNWHFLFTDMMRIHDPPTVWHLYIMLIDECLDIRVFAQFECWELENFINDTLRIIKLEANLVDRVHINWCSAIYGCLIILILSLPEVSFAFGFSRNDITKSQNVMKSMYCVCLCLCVCVCAYVCLFVCMLKNNEFSWTKFWKDHLECCSLHQTY
jgi:hypothetical protein